VANKDMAQRAGKFARHVVPAAIKPIHSLWHEVIGFVFLAIAFIASTWVYRHYGTLGPQRAIIVLPLIVICVGYGVSSFLKARRISRS
jgi:hypothetical protein